MLYMYRDVKTKRCDGRLRVPLRHEIGCQRKIPLGKGTILNCATLCACVRVFPLGLCAREFTFSLSPLPIRPDA